MDICVRLIQKQTVQGSGASEFRASGGFGASSQVLARLNYFRDLLNSYHSQQGLRPPSKAWLWGVTRAWPGGDGGLLAEAYAGEDLHVQAQVREA